jgi:hypothetical protein
MNKTDNMINKHIASVQLRIEKLSLELEKRIMLHDSSKLEEPEHSMWLEMDKEKDKPAYGTSEYFERKERFAKVFEQHYNNEKNTHHPEHFLNGVDDMNIIDVVEMLCDWVSYKKVISYTEASKIIDENSERFGISDQLASILKNTLRDYFVSLGGGNEEPEYLKDIKEKIK